MNFEYRSVFDEIIIIKSFSRCTHVTLWKSTIIWR